MSRDDGMDGESNSIVNQKNLLLQKAKEKGLTDTKFYVDDGYTGTNFNRPGFQQMLSDIEMGYIYAVMVKDLSRLGRDYVSVGNYTDVYQILVQNALATVIERGSCIQITWMYPESNCIVMLYSDNISAETALRIAQSIVLS